MSRPNALPTVVVVVAVAALVAGSAWLETVRERRYPAPAIDEVTLYVQSPSAVTRLTKGYNALAADLYWIRALQYYGDRRLGVQKQEAAASGAPASEAYGQLYPLLDLTTSLDPQFNIAYRFGSIFLAEAQPGGAGRPDQAIALLEKGLQARPDKWEYMQDIGFVHYWWRHDYNAAADWFERAANTKGAPWFLQALAATTRAEGGDLRTSRLMWESIRSGAEIDWLRNQAERRLKQLDAQEFIAGLQQTVDRLTDRTGVPPADWDALIRARAIPGIPVDPDGVPYELDANGTVRLSQRSPLYPLVAAPAPLRAS